MSYQIGVDNAGKELDILYALRMVAGVAGVAGTVVQADHYEAVNDCSTPPSPRTLSFRISASTFQFFSHLRRHRYHLLPVSSM